MNSRRAAFIDQVRDRNNTLEDAGIHLSYFTGYFAYERTKSGCAVYASCANEKDIDYVKSQLRIFLDNQTFDDSNDPIVA